MDSYRFRKKKNGQHKGRVECIVSERWLQFPKTADARLAEGEVMAVSVMTMGSDDRPHKCRRE